MSISVNDIFGSKDTILEEVIILPPQRRRGSPTAFSLPAGYVWSDFEYIELYCEDGVSSSQGSIVAQTTVTKDSIGVNSAYYANYYSGSSVWDAVIIITSDTAGTWQSTGNGSVWMVKGYTKRYASRNLSKIINVNNGIDVGVNRRIEIDIATELGPDYVGRDLLVEAEVYWDASGGGTAGWGNSGWIFEQPTLFSYGVRAHVLNDKIVVQTASTQLLANSKDCGSPFGKTTGTYSSAPIRVKVWKIDQYITPTTSGGAGKTVLWSGNLRSSGSIVFNDDPTKYDDIRIEGYTDNTAGFGTYQGRFSRTLDSESFLNVDGLESIVHIHDVSSGSSYWVSQMTSITTSGAQVNTAVSNWTGGITKVYGINYQ